MHWMNHGEELGRFEEMSLNGIPHLSLTYEKNLANKSDQQDTIKQVCDFLNIEYHEAKSKYKKVSPITLRDSISNYDELIEFLTGTKYEKFLD